MILSSTSPYGLLKEFSIACSVKDNAVFCSYGHNLVLSYLSPPRNY